MTNLPNEPIDENSPKSTDAVESEATFEALNLPEPLIEATKDLGFTTCTDIQRLTLPVIAKQQDIAAQAQTGTGKTAAFLLGSFKQLLNHRSEDTDREPNQPRMLVIAPTRELAVQIKQDAENLGKYTSLKCLVVYGGIDYTKQKKQLSAGVDVLIGTPGRLIDYYKQKIFNLKKLEIAVLDEADRMFDLGFISDIRFLLRRMPPPDKRLSMLFSATLSHRVMELAYEHMNNPQTIKTQNDEVTADGVEQSLYQPASEEKIPLLLGLLRSLNPSRSIVFVNTKRAAEQVEGYLKGNQFECGTLSGDVRQNKRQRILKDFTEGTLPVLIATDVAARGLHIDDVTHVFNFDLPQQAEDYVHRIGRTARAGTRGVAVSFACETYSFSLPEIQEYIGKSIPLTMIEDELLIDPLPPQKTSSKHRSKRLSKKRSNQHKRSRQKKENAKPTDKPARRSSSSPGVDKNQGIAKDTEQRKKSTKSSSARKKTAKSSSKKVSNHTESSSSDVNAENTDTPSTKKRSRRNRRRRPSSRTKSEANHSPNTEKGQANPDSAPE